MGLIWDLPIFPAKNSPQVNLTVAGQTVSSQYSDLTLPNAPPPPISKMAHSACTTGAHRSNYPSSCRSLLANRLGRHVPFPLGSVLTWGIFD